MSIDDYDMNIVPFNELSRIIVERCIYVGDDLGAFREWLNHLACVHPRAGTEGYVLDLTNGKIWAALDTSDVAQSVHDDVRICIVEQDDAKASEAFLMLTRDCDPSTARNKLTYSFDMRKLPRLAEACSIFASLELRNLDQVGAWLKAESQRLEDDLDCRPKMRSSIRSVLETHAARPGLNKDLILQAEKNQWPAWATECLPSLYVPLSTQPDGRKRALVWHYILACVPESEEYEPSRDYCNGQVCEILMSGETAEFVESIAPVFEENRINNPYRSDEATWAMVITSIVECGIRTSQAPIGEMLSKVVAKLDEDNEIDKFAEKVAEKLPQQNLEPGLRRTLEGTSLPDTMVNHFLNKVDQVFRDMGTAT